MMQSGVEMSGRNGDPGPARAVPAQSATKRAQHDPSNSLAACARIVILGRTGSGKTTLARQLAAALHVPHVELDSLYFGPDFSTAPLEVLRERTSAAIAGERWVTDGNKRAVRDLVWPRADTIVWLDYPFSVSVWRVAQGARRRAPPPKAPAGAPPRSRRRPARPAGGGGSPGSSWRPPEACSRRSGHTPVSVASTRGCS